MEFQQGRHDLTRRGLPEVDAASVDRFLVAANEAGAVAVVGGRSCEFYGGDRRRGRVAGID